MGTSITMIDLHYGHLAVDSYQHAVSLLDALALERAVDAGWTSARRPAKPHSDSVSRPPGRRSRRAVDARWTSVGEEVERHDLPSPDDDASDREGLSVPERDASRAAVDERRLHLQSQPRVEQRLARDRPRSADLGRSARGTEVGAHDDLRVEQLEQRLEVAVARRHEERAEILSAGGPACVTVTLIDGLVLARSVFEHSANYESVVAFGRFDTVEERAERLAALESFAETIVPGRWSEVRQPSAKELKATMILALEIEEAAAKVRSGPPDDDDSDDAALDVWAGKIPIVTDSRGSRRSAVVRRRESSCVILPRRWRQRHLQRVMRATCDHRETSHTRCRCDQLPRPQMV
jgi:hypothetical protein